MSKFYQINAKAAGDGVKASAEILIYSTIGKSFWEETVDAQSFIAELNALDVSNITVRINSLGGSVPDGIAMFNALKRHPATITTINDGVAYSMASLLLMAGDEGHRQMADNALFMVHGPATWGGEARPTATEHRKLADMLDAWAQSMANSYAQATGKSKAEIEALLTDGEDHYYTAEEAKAFGFIDEVTDGLAIAANFKPITDMAARAFYADQRANIPETFKFDHQSKTTFGDGEAKEKIIPLAKQDAEPTVVTINVAAATSTQEQTMPETVTAADVKAAQKQALADNQVRRDAITAEFKPWLGHDGVQALLDTCRDDVDMDVSAASQALLKHLGQHSTPVVGATVQTVEDEKDKRISAQSDAVLARAGIKGFKHDSANPYRGAKMLDFARMSLERAGVNAMGMNQMDVVGQAFTQTTSDFTVLLENAMHKALQAGYATAPDTWSRFCSIGSVGDFRPHNRYRTGSIGSYDALNEAGEYKTKKIPDGERATVSADTRGNIINLTRKVMVDDDLGAFVGLMFAMGRAGKRTIEQMVYALLAENSGNGPTMPDGKALFHADHGNLVAAAAHKSAPSVVSIEQTRVLMGSQKGVGGDDYLDITPAIWLGPLGLGGEARVVNGSMKDPFAEKVERNNPVYNLFSDIVDSPRLSGAGWYMFADPSDAPVIEVSFLDGMQEPYLEVQDGFDVDGARIKGRLDVGVDAIDYRGAAKNPGE